MSSIHQIAHRLRLPAKRGSTIDPLNMIRHLSAKDTRPGCHEHSDGTGVCPVRARLPSLGHCLEGNAVLGAEKSLGATGWVHAAKLGGLICMPRCVSVRPNRVDPI